MRATSVARHRRRLAGHLRAAARRAGRDCWRVAYEGYDVPLSAAGLGRAGPARVARRAQPHASPRRRPASTASRIVGAVVRLAARRPGVRGRRRRAAARRDDLDGPARRRGVRRARRAGRPGAAVRDDRLQPRRRARRARRSPGSATHEPEVFARHGAVPAARLVRRLAASGELGVDPSNASSIDAARRPRARDWARGTCDGVRHRPGRARAGACPPHGVLGHDRAVAARGDRAARRRRSSCCGCGDEMAATLGAGVVEPGVVCDVIGTAEPICAVTSEPALRPDPARRAASRTPTPRRGCSRTRASSPAAPTAGSATSSAARSSTGPARSGVDVYELLNELAAQAPAGSEGAIWLPA